MEKEIMPRLIYPINEGYVSSLKPAIQGTGEPGAAVSGSVDTHPFSVTVAPNGVWCYNIETELTDCTEHDLSFTQVSPDGQTCPQTAVKFKTDTKLLFPHTLTFPANGQVINTNVPTISGTGKAGALIEMNLTGTVYHSVVDQDGSWQIKAETLPEGAAFLYLIQKDMGNVSPAICSGFTVDTVAPQEPVIAFPGDSSFINEPKPVFSGEGEPNASIDAVVDERRYAAVVNAQGKWSFEAGEALADDAHIFSARQVDRAGNISPETVSVFTVKTVQPGAPVVSSPVSGTITANASPVLCGTGEPDCVVVTRVYDEICAALVGPDGNWELGLADKLPDGSHSLKLCQVDPAGNFSPSVDLALCIDTTVPPAPVILYPEKGRYVSGSDFTILGTGEPDATVSCTVAGKDYTAKVAGDGSWSISVSDNENIKYKIHYIIVAKQTDLAGNAGRILKTEFYVDKEALKAPAVSFPKAGESLNADRPVISGTGKPGATVNLTVGGQSYTARVPGNTVWSISVTDSLPQGENKMTVTQTEFGNVSPATAVSFTVKLTAPAKPGVLSPTEGETIENDAVILKGCGEPGATVCIRLDDACYTAAADPFGAWEYTVSGLLSGEHCALVSQKDPAGNESPCTTLRFISKNQQPLPEHLSGPVSCLIGYNPPGPALTAQTILTLRTSCPVTIGKVTGSEFSIIAANNGLYRFDFELPGGAKGNVAAGVTWIDSLPPVISVDTNGGNVFSADKTVSYYKCGGARVKNALLNGTPFASGLRVCDEGVYKVEVTDTAGNLSTETFLIDKTAPEITGLENGSTHHDDVVLNLSDSLSGVKSAVLNGTNILSGSVITEPGSYTLTVTDNAGNIAERSFTIQKA